MIRLHGTSNTRAFRVLWMLEELGVPYELVKVDFHTGATRSPEFLRLNPNGRVPVLEDGELVLFESLAINLYLAETYGRDSLWPKGASDRARTVQWSFWAMTECERNLFAVLFQSGGEQFETWRKWSDGPEFRETHPGQRMPSAEEGRAALQPPLRALDAHLGGSGSMLGGAFSAADLNVASVLAIARLAQLDLSAFPSVDVWLTRATARAALGAAARK
ncbi:MAG TPA: glutathione S-transferase [Myxococcota bacterium]|nr:glutathione S-transferase [Myxococcota bacterium]